MFFYCPTTNTPIPFSMRCNGYVDCPYGEDEMECTPNGVPAKRPDSVWTLDESNFQQALSMGQNVLVEFYAPWCKACVIFEPKYKEAADEATRNGLDVVFAKVNTDQNPYLTQTFGVNTFPRLLLFPRNGASPKRQDTTMNQSRHLLLLIIPLHIV